MKPYPIQLEISGPTAMWPRPDTGSSPVSYVAPTFSAVKGILEFVLRWKLVTVLPTKREICAQVQFHRCSRNDFNPESEFRPETHVGETENHGLPTILRNVFDQTGNLSPN